MNSVPLSTIKRKLNNKQLPRKSSRTSFHEDEVFEEEDIVNSTAFFTVNQSEKDEYLDETAIQSEIQNDNPT